MVGRVPVHSKYPIAGGEGWCCDARASAGEGGPEDLAKDVKEARVPVPRSRVRAQGLRSGSGGVGPTQGRAWKLHWSCNHLPLPKCLRTLTPSSSPEVAAGRHHGAGPNCHSALPSPESPSGKPPSSLIQRLPSRCQSDKPGLR